jgi:hypothetical protein
MTGLRFCPLFPEVYPVLLRASENARTAKKHYSRVNAHDWSAGAAETTVDLPTAGGNTGGNRCVTTEAQRSRGAKKIPGNTASDVAAFPGIVAWMTPTGSQQSPESREIEHSNRSVVSPVVSSGEIQRAIAILQAAGLFGVAELIRRHGDV